MLFKELGLRPELLTQVEKQGYTTPTPIQEKAIPIIMKGGDILAGAQTGTGKTAAFTLPLLHRLSTCGNSNGRRPRALIVTPTRELAAQVGESVDTYGQGLRLNSAVIFGGVGINPQISKLRRGVDIVIGTPGRLLDLNNQRALDLSRIEILILDEADRMLNMGFIHDIRRIIKLVPKRRQTLFFSATYSNEITTLANTILHRPDYVEVARKNTAAETVNQTVYHVSKSHKRALLSHIITEKNLNQILVFTKTKHGANRLCTQLQRDGINSAAIHGNKSQGARTRALEDFKTGKVRTLVATDIAARGIDIEQLPYVINYELPHVSEDYVHRIGRTGRAGSTGDAISLVAPDEQKLLRGIERLIKIDIPVTTLDSETEKELALKVQSAPKEPDRRPQQSNHSRRPQRQSGQNDRRRSHYRRSR